jgi:hypothetical protein
MTKKSSGFGLMETIVALGIFSVIVTAGVAGFIPALRSGRASREHTQALSLAQEGVEAVRSIRDRNFANITAGTFGIGISSSLWAFSGTSDVNNKYFRQLIISQASRDAGGSLVGSGGSTDPDTFIVTSKVNWNYGVGDTRQLTTDSVLTNWRKAIGGLGYNGIVVFSRGTSVASFGRNFVNSSDNFSSQYSIATNTNSRNLVIKTNPTKTEAIVAAMNNTGALYVYCFNGTSWSNEWNVGTGITATTRPFDVEYETNTGDALVVYSTGTTTTNELNYRTKPGSSDCGSASWSSATNYNPAGTTNKIQWIKMGRDRRSSSNLVAVSYADNIRRLATSIWSGTAFVGETLNDTNLEIGTSTAILKQDVDSFDLEYESLSGDLMVAWGNGAGTNAVNGTRFQVCANGTAPCAWGVGGTIRGLLDDATNLDISANPQSDQMVFASIGNAGADLQAGYWNGVGWNGRANLDTAAQGPLSGTRLVATGWLGSAGTTRSVIVYNDSAAVNLGWYVGVGATFTVQTDFHYRI